MAKRLLEDTADPSSPLMGLIRQGVSFMIIPICNPDGYSYTWESDRLWRKNRNKICTNPSQCACGVDLNRNFDDHWGLAGSSKTPYSEIYQGPSSASELETQALQSLFRMMNSGGRRIVLALDFHSYSQKLLWPWSFSRCAKTPSLSAYKNLAQYMAKKLSSHSQDESIRNYDAILSSLMYESSGSASDYYAQHPQDGHPETYSLTVELPPSERLGSFIVSREKIKPIGEEWYSSLIDVVQFAIDNPI